jgi:acetyl-CoA carboxylase carboxyltransferase component
LQGDERPTVWGPEIEELARRRDLALRLGGPEKVARHHEQGRLTVRERIDLVVDPGSFQEIGRLTGRPAYEGQELTGVTPANHVFGRGQIDGRPVVVAGDDFTIRGGSADASIPQKATYAVRLALEHRMPLVQLVDGSGGGGGMKALDSADPGAAAERAALGSVPPVLRDWGDAVRALGVVPIASMVGGSVAGLGALKVCHSHYSVMVRGTSQVFAAGPPLVRYTGEDVTREELGGSSVHTRNGVVSDEAVDEADALARIRRFLSYLPSSVHELPPIEPCDDPVDRAEPWLADAVPRERRKVFDIRAVIDAVVDTGSFFEMSKFFGRSLVTGLARLGGRPVAVVASDPKHLGGGLDAAACQKLRRFVDLANTFHLPRVGLYDIPGLVIGTRAEAAGTVRFATEALAGVYQTTIPQCAVVLRRFYGLGAAAQVNGDLLTPIYAWPSAEWGSMPLEGGIEAAYRAELDASDDPVALRHEIVGRFGYARSPFRAAERFAATDVLDPTNTRRVLCDFAAVAYRALQPGPALSTMRP